MGEASPRYQQQKRRTKTKIVRLFSWVSAPLPAFAVWRPLQASVLSNSNKHKKSFPHILVLIICDWHLFHGHIDNEPHPFDILLTDGNGTCKHHPYQMGPFSLSISFRDINANADKLLKRVMQRFFVALELTNKFVISRSWVQVQSAAPKTLSKYRKCFFFLSLSYYLCV